jgi:hypothetical protein
VYDCVKCAQSRDGYKDSVTGVITNSDTVCMNYSGISSKLGCCLWSHSLSVSQICTRLAGERVFGTEKDLRPHVKDYMKRTMKSRCIHLSEAERLESWPARYPPARYPNKPFTPRPEEQAHQTNLYMPCPVRGDLRAVTNKGEFCGPVVAKHYHVYMGYQLGSVFTTPLGPIPFP